MSVSPAGAEVVISDDPKAMAATGAARFIAVLRQALAARGGAHVVLTGGTGGTSLLEAVAAAPDRDRLDWAKVDLWWGDERFLPAGDPDRNETQARAALLDALALDPARVHPMAASDSPAGDDVEAGAAAYARELAAAADRGPAAPGGLLPVFDLLLLGVGPDGHVASLFPGHPGFAVRSGTVIAVRDSPKPPPTRISLTLPALQVAREAWLLAAGAGKAAAVARALAPDPDPLPAASVHGTECTLWLLDRAAAADR